MEEYITPITDEEALKLGMIKTSGENAVKASTGKESENIYDVIGPHSSCSVISAGVQKDDNEMFLKKNMIKRFECELIRIESLRQKMTRQTKVLIVLGVLLSLVAVVAVAAVAVAAAAVGGSLFKISIPFLFT